MLARPQLDVPQARTRRWTAPVVARPRIDAVRLQSAIVRAGTPVLAWIHVTHGDPSRLECRAGTPGFELLYETMAVGANEVLLTLRVARTDPTAGRLCLLRFLFEGSSASTSITVAAG